MADGNDFAMGFALGQDNNGGNNCNGMGSWGEMIFAIIILAMFAGGDGFGNGGLFGGGSGTQGEIQRGFDTSNIVSKLDGINSGLCDGFYAQNTNLLTGFNGINTTLMQGFHGVDNAVCTLGYQTQAGFNALGNQLASCCCETQRAIDGVNYNMATNTCALQTSMANNTRDIIDSQNAGVRAILDKMCQQEMDALRSENTTLKFAASQAAQNNYIDAVGNSIVAQLRAPVPQPAYVVPNPNCCYGNATVSFNGNGCGCNSGCGC